MDGLNLNLTLYGSGDYAACCAILGRVLRSVCSEVAHKASAPCDRGHWRRAAAGGGMGPWMALSEFWYSTDDVFGIGGAYDADKFAGTADRYCRRPWSAVHAAWAAGRYPRARPSRMRLQCFKAAWMATMLHDGYAVPRNASVVTVDAVSWRRGCDRWRRCCAAR